MDGQVGTQATQPILDRTTGPYGLLSRSQQRLGTGAPVGRQCCQQGLPAGPQDGSPRPGPAQQMDRAGQERLSGRRLWSIQCQGKEHQLWQSRSKPGDQADQLVLHPCGSQATQCCASVGGRDVMIVCLPNNRKFYAFRMGNCVPARK